MHEYKAKVTKIVDGDTIDVTLDLGFDILLNQRVRLAGIDSPEKRTRDAAEKALGLDATEWMTKRLEKAPELIIKTAVEGSMGKYGRVLGWLFVGEEDISLNEQMINEGFAWEYDGGTKQKDLSTLINIRKSLGTY